MPLPSDYPCWVYDPTGVNPPMFVKDDPGYVALLNSPLPATAIFGSPPATSASAATASTSTPQLAGTLTQVNGTTVTPVGAKFTRSPTRGTLPTSVVVNASPHVVSKR